MKEYGSKLKITSSDIHLKSIFANDFYIELGNIEINVMKRILNYELININELTYYPIQNKSVGSCKTLVGELKNKIPYMFYKTIVDADYSRYMFLTYGVLDYYNVNAKDRFMPIFLLPIEMKYLDGEFYVQLISKPFENPLILNVVKDSLKINFKQNRSLNSLYELDYMLTQINRLSGCNVKLENYLTYGTVKKREVLEPGKIFKRVKLDDDYFVNRVYGSEKNYFMSLPYTKAQRKFLVEAMQGDNLTLSGHDGTGKTTVLKDICVNLINEGKKIVYVSNKDETLKDVNNFFRELQIHDTVMDLTDPFGKNGERETIVFENETFDVNLLIDELKKLYKQVEDYESLIGGRISNFRFSEIINQLSILVELEHSEEKIISDDELVNLNYIYKYEFERIKTSLENIQTNLYKIDSFKNSVWNQIPIINSIKYANQIISLINQINNGYLELIEKKLRLENEFGLKEIVNYANFRKVVYLIDSFNTDVIPEIWKKGFVNYKEASSLYGQLKSDIYSYQESLYYISTKYLNIDDLDVDEKLRAIYGNYFKEGESEKINNILKNTIELKNLVGKVIVNKKILDEAAHDIRNDLHWNFTENKTGVNTLLSFADLVINNDLNKKLCNVVVNENYDDVINKIGLIKESVRNKKQELDELTKEYPNLTEEKINQAIQLIQNEPRKKRAIRKKYNNIEFSKVEELFERFFNIQKDLVKLHTEYTNITGMMYTERENDVIILRNIKDFYDSIKSKTYKKIIEKFFETVDIRKKNGTYKSLCDELIKYINSYNIITSAFDVFSEKNIYLNEDKFIYCELEELENIDNYVNSVYGINLEMIKHFVQLEDSYVKYESYLHLNSVLKEHRSLLNYLVTHKDYIKYFGHLYNAEKTNVSDIGKSLQMYSDVNNIFKSSGNLVKSFHIMNSLKELITASEDNLNKLNETLKIYAKIFKDGITRYYYNDFNSIIDYLNKLLNSKDELISYLNITNGLSVIHGYNLKSLVNYIANTDKCDNIVNDFEFLYFNILKDKYLAGEDGRLLKDRDYIKLLDKIYSLESRIRKVINGSIVKQIYNKTSHRFNEYIIKKRKYNNFISKDSRHQLYLANNLIIENWLNLQLFDVIILDDAEALSVPYLQNLKTKQIIISGSYHVYKNMSHNLLSLYFDDRTTVFKERFINTPKKLMMNASKLEGLMKSSVFENDGIDIVHEEIEKYIFNLYNKNKDVKINYFIKDLDKVYNLIEEVAYVFSKNNIENSEILNFLSYNINICDLVDGKIGHSDYNILDLSDYRHIDANIEATNAFDNLLYPSEKLVIYDNNNYLISEDNTVFIKNVRKLSEYIKPEDLYNHTTMDQCIEIITNSLREKGYAVYPTNVNTDMNVLIEEKFVGISVLFSENSYVEALNEYRCTKSKLSHYGWDVIFTTKMAYLQGLNSVSDSLELQIKKISNKKGKK